MAGHRRTGAFLGECLDLDRPDRIDRNGLFDFAVKIPFFYIEPLSRPEFKARPHFGVDPNLTKNESVVLDYLDIAEQQNSWLVEKTIEGRNIESDTRRLVSYLGLGFVLINGPQLFSLVIGLFKK
jgi:hypothetical protein